MIYGYARVSTKGQDRYGNSLEDQVAKLTAHGCAKVYRDSCTGTKMDRPEFNKLMRVIRPGDTLVVTKLDRFARTASDGAKVIHDLVARGIVVDILNMGRADNTSMGKLMVQILLAFAEFERDCIIERTQAGKEVAKANNPNWRVGRKEVKIDEALFCELRKENSLGRITAAECCARLGISESTWYKRKRTA